EKLVANPDEIIGVLVFEGNAGADAGVHEQKISAAVTVVQALQEQFVGPREYREKASAQLSGGFAVARMNAVGGQCLKRAQLLPMGKKALVSKKAFHQGFVIAAQAHRAIFDDTDSERVDDGFRIRSAVDVIAQINLDSVLNRPAPDIVIDTCDNLHQEIGAAVDIADGIDARSGWCRSDHGL